MMLGAVGVAFIVGAALLFVAYMVGYVRGLCQGYVDGDRHATARENARELRRHMPPP